MVSIGLYGRRAFVVSVGAAGKATTIWGELKSRD